MPILKSEFDPDVIPCTELTFESRVLFDADYRGADWPDLLDRVHTFFGDLEPVHQGYRDLRRSLGIGWRNRIPAPIRLSGRTERLAEVPDLIRAYNRISGWTGIALGLHDLDLIAGGTVTLGRLTEPLDFERVDGKEGQGVPGEYGYLDAEGLICRLEVMQCRRTSVRAGTSRFLMIFQGNPRTPASYLKAVREWTMTAFGQVGV